MTNNLPVNNSKFALKPSSVNEISYVFDIETDGLYDQATKVHCIVLYDINSGTTLSFDPDSIDSALEHLSRAHILVGHNICFYDIPVLNKLFPDVQINARIIDTLICSRLIWPKEVLHELDIEQYPQVPSHLRGSPSLKAWGWRLANHKLDFKEFKEYSQEMLDYCIQDVAVTFNLWQLIVAQNYMEPSLKLEHDFALAINRQIRSGVPFNLDAALDLVDDLRTKQTELEEKLRKVFPSIKHETTFTPKVNNKARGYVKGEPFTKVTYETFNPGSRQQIVDRLQKKYGWVPEKTTEKGNPSIDDDVLAALPYPEAQLLAEYMLLNKRLGQIADGNNSWIKLYNNDTGCIHGDVITNGCITGRCAHRNPNMGQVPAGYSPYGKECRSLFVPPDGWDLIGIDAKALELRCLAGYLAIWDNGEYAKLVTDESIDIHTYNQKQFGVETRDISKRLLYGMLYGCGSVKAGSIIDPNLKDEEELRILGRSAIDGFMRGVPALKALKMEIDKTIGLRGYLIGLDRRQLYCRSAFKGLNVLLQSAGAILMKQVVINVYQNITEKLGLAYEYDWQQLLMVHDEIQIACKPQYTEAIREQAMLAFPQAQQFFGFRCDIEGDSRVGSSWAETH